jgi:hypothetical protein
LWEVDCGVVRVVFLALFWDFLDPIEVRLDFIWEAERGYNKNGNEVAPK